MDSSNSWPARAGRSLSGHLDRLRRRVDDLRERLREAVAHALGEVVAGAVQEAAHAVLADLPARPDAPGRRPWSRDPPPLWHEPLDRHPQDEPDDPWYDAEGGEDDRDEDDDGEPLESVRRPAAGVTRPARWCVALAAGCQAAAWWLRRPNGRHPVLTALGVALAGGAVAYLGGPLAAAGAVLAGSVLRLARLADQLQVGAAALRPIDTP